jgi:TolB protein
VFSVVCLQRASRIAFAWDGDIFLAPVGGVVVNLTNHPAWDSEPSLSPDRRRIVFASGRDRDEGDLYLLDIDLGTLRRLTTGPGFNRVGSQAWSPDGSKIVFSSTRADSLNDVYILSLDTGDLLQLTDDPQANDFHPAWSPDGFSIVFSRIRRGSDGTFHVGIYRMSAVDGSGIVELAEDGFSPTWSPDGTRIAFTANVSDEFTPNEVAVVDAGGAGPAAIVATGWSPTWSPDGGSIAYNRFGATVLVGVFDGALLTQSLAIFQGFSPSWR